MKTTTMTLTRIFFVLLLAASTASAQTTATEADFYRIATVPIPEGVILEVGGLDVLPDGQLAVSTRRGDIWLVKNPAGARPEFKRFAHGLHEALGVAYRDGVIYTAQRGELTRLRDLNGDEVADRYETVYSWPLEGNYHEYSFGPLIKPDGTMIVTLNLGWIGYGASLSKWRGWMLEITPDGQMTPIATGMRSPAGFGFNMEGEVFYGENQGDWIGSGWITHVEKGDFVGNPAGLRWTDEPGSPLSIKPEDIPDTGQPMVEIKEQVPDLKLPAVWLPHSVLGNSTSDILADTTKGAFGPFAGQVFVGDQSMSNITRVFMEEVNGVWQGAAFPFRQGFSSGVLRMVWGKDNAMYVGMTSRGWGSTGREPYGLQRLEWTGLMPFEIYSVEARPDGFELTFTKPVDRSVAADPATYQASGFTYHYHSTYGSEPINQETLPVRAVEVSEDGLKARISVGGLRKGYIHELKLPALRSDSGEPLLHDTAYYTLNEIPSGTKMRIPAPARQMEGSTDGSSAAAEQLAKRQTTMPASWNGKADVTVTMRPIPGLQFETTSIDVKAGTRVELVFDNVDDMMHNFVVVQPGASDAVGDAGLRLGLEGSEKGYVPDLDAVLFHTTLLEPGTKETIYFQAPTTPGTYEFLCTFPGHAFTMRGVLRVVGD